MEVFASATITLDDDAPSCGLLYREVGFQFAGTLPAANFEAVLSLRMPDFVDTQLGFYACIQIYAGEEF